MKITVEEMLSLIFNEDENYTEIESWEGARERWSINMFVIVKDLRNNKFFLFEYKQPTGEMDSIADFYGENDLIDLDEVVFEKYTSEGRDDVYLWFKHKNNKPIHLANTKKILEEIK